jgi:hypothetical protein
MAFFYGRGEMKKEKENNAEQFSIMESMRKIIALQKEMIAELEKNRVLLKEKIRLLGGEYRRAG